MCIGYTTGEENGVVWSRCSESDKFFKLYEQADLVIGFNLKYDLHVLRKWGLPQPRRIFCCQVAQYILERQTHPYPSLEGVAKEFGVGASLGSLEEYWNKGIQTSEIDREVVKKYVLGDVETTHQIYLKQQQLIKSSQSALIRLAMLDLLCLEEIEWNGLKYDRSGIEEKIKQIETEIHQIQSQLNLYHSVPSFNWNSSDHLSALLFGGTIVQEIKVPCGTYKTGKHAGEVKYKKETVEHHLPRMYKPLRKTDGGKYSVDEDSLTLLGDSDLIRGILKIKELQKLNSTYFRGLLEKAEKLHFEPNYIHANFNQVVTRTGRLSSSKPNLQNSPEELDEHFITRF